MNPAASVDPVFWIGNQHIGNMKKTYTKSNTLTRWHGVLAASICAMG